MAKILIAEDDTIMREILVDKINKAGFFALPTQDGEEALRAIREQKPDLILLDMLLPLKSGLEILREMSMDTSIKSIPVISISNSDNAETIREAKALGVRDFLLKALSDSSDVLEKIKLVLAGGLPASVPSPYTPPTTPVIEPKIVSVTPLTKPMKSVLIVEDDKFLREIATQKLESEGFMVASATTGTEALTYLMTNPRPDIIVLDLILPGMSGYEVLEKTKQNPGLKDVPVLILSNLGQEEDIERAKKLGATDYLVKAHFSFAEIIKKIHELVG